MKKYFQRSIGLIIAGGFLTFLVLIMLILLSMLFWPFYLTGASDGQPINVFFYRHYELIPITYIGYILLHPIFLFIGKKFLEFSQFLIEKIGEFLN